ncbi:MAG: hypothetical protein JNK15_20700 [Planctomycetes bacterium]|nr:hypothetical protein [Planctomycetota bacterium]
MHRTSWHFVAFVAANTVVVAQTTHTVGPGGFAQIAAALAVAAPGDTILVHPGNYTGFTASVGVTIRAVTSGTVFLTSLTTVNCPAPQRVHLLDLDTGDVHVQNATCTFDGCRVLQTSLNGPAVFANQAVVFFQDCVVGRSGMPQGAWFSTASGVYADNATVSAIDSTFRGRDRDYLNSAASAGVYLTNGSTLHASGCTMRGGDGVSTYPSTAVGLRASNSTAWVTDSTLIGGGAYNLPGTPPISCPTDATTGRLSRCTFVPANCTPVIATNGNGVGVHRSAPWQANATFTLGVRGPANTFVGVFGSSDVDAVTIPVLEQPVLLGMATVVPITLLLTDGTGAANVSWAIPGGTAGASLWLQVVADGNAPLQTSAVVGGIVRP